MKHGGERPAQAVLNAVNTGAKEDKEDKNMEVANRYPYAAKGLHLMFIGQILMLVGVALGWVPFVGGLMALAGGVMELVGLYQAGTDDQGYRTALVFQAVSVAVNLLAGFLGEGSILNGVLSVAANVASVMAVVQVCTTTACLLHAVGNETLSRRASTVMKLYVACTAVSIVCGILGIIPIVNIVAGLVAAVAAIALLVGYVLYLMFLDRKSVV